MGRDDEILEANRRINVLQERWKQIQQNWNRWLEKHPNAWSPFSTLKACWEAEALDRKFIWQKARSILSASQGYELTAHLSSPPLDSDLEFTMLVAGVGKKKFYTVHFRLLNNPNDNYILPRVARCPCKSATETREVGKELNYPCSHVLVFVLSAWILFEVPIDQQMSMFQALTKDSSVCGLPLTVRNLPKAAQRGWMKEKGFYPAPSDCLRPLSQTGSTILDAPAGWVFSISSRTGKLNFQRLSLLELAHRAFVDPPTPQNALPLRELCDQLFYWPCVPRWHVPTDWFVFFFFRTTSSSPPPWLPPRVLISA
jgi:hypothetical protein